MASRCTAGTALLDCRGLSSGWGETQILTNVSLTLAQGETVAILGRNGVGKSTLLSTIAGRATLHAGEIRFNGLDIARAAAFERARMGIGYVPQEREVFPSLTVMENLTVAARGPSRMLEQVLDLFPRLKERRANLGGQLSGGEQQMLSIGRALMLNPTLLLLDEPMEGLSPLIVEQLVQAIRQLQSAQGLSLVLVEQHARLALRFTDSVIVLDRGSAVYDNVATGTAPDLQQIEDRISVPA